MMWVGFVALGDADLRISTEAELLKNTCGREKEGYIKER